MILLKILVCVPNHCFYTYLTTIVSTVSFYQVTVNNLLIRQNIYLMTKIIYNHTCFNPFN